jgi:hypothetical protein
LGAALEHYGGDADVTAGHLLDGSDLPGHLAKMDTTTPWPPPGHVSLGRPVAGGGSGGGGSGAGVLGSRGALLPKPALGGGGGGTFIRRKVGTGGYCSPRHQTHFETSSGG